MNIRSKVLGAVAAIAMVAGISVTTPQPASANPVVIAVAIPAKVVVVTVVAVVVGVIVHTIAKAHERKCARTHACNN